MTIYSLHIVLTFFPATLVGLVLEGILLLGISLTIVSICAFAWTSRVGKDDVVEYYSERVGGWFQGHVGAGAG